MNRRLGNRGVPPYPIASSEGRHEPRVVHTIAIDKNDGGTLTIAAKVGDHPENTDIWLINGNTRIGEAFVQAFMGGERLTERDAEAAYQAAREERESRT